MERPPEELQGSPSFTAAVLCKLCPPRTAHIAQVRSILQLGSQCTLEAQENVKDGKKQLVLAGNSLIRPG